MHLGTLKSTIFRKLFLKKNQVCNVTCKLKDYAFLIKTTTTIPGRQDLKRGKIMFAVSINTAALSRLFPQTLAFSLSGFSADCLLY